jgi:hypothetical protein
MTDMERLRAEELQDAQSKAVGLFREIEDRGILRRRLAVVSARPRAPGGRDAQTLNRRRLQGVDRALCLPFHLPGKRWAITFVFAALASAQPAPEQPLPYSHKLHAGSLQLKCKGCHVNADPGDAMGFPSVATCMSCHSSIAAKKPSIEKLAAAAKSGQEIPWVRVYQTPPFVWFSHRSHLQAGSTCENCHGPVAEREKMNREGDISMGGCITCHRSKKVSTNCNFCHERP